MTWLTQTAAADTALQSAILANGLVNLRGKSDSWFEMDRLNEFLNLEMKILMTTRRTSTIEIPELFRRTALTGNYCTELKVAIEAAFGENSNTRHQVKDASTEVRHLAYQIASQSIVKHPSGRQSRFQPANILREGATRLDHGIKKFNQRVVRGYREGRHDEDDEDDEDDLDNAKSTPIYVLDDFVTGSDEDD
jgi:chromosomal replication initiation ATPase DnaA